MRRPRLCDPSRHGPAFIVIIFLVLVLAACSKSQPGTANTRASAGSPMSVPSLDHLRIICLSPAMTDLLIGLGLREQIVGRDQFEEQLSDAVPRVGDLINLNYEQIIALHPTNVILQAGKQGTPDLLISLAGRNNWNVTNIQVDGLKDVVRAIGDLSRVLGDTVPSARAILADRAQILVQHIHDALVPLDPSTASECGPILVLYGIDPPSAFGPGSYLSDTLEAIGGRNALTVGSSWQELNLEQVTTINPWAILIIDSGNSGGGPRVPGELSQLGSIARLNIDAVAHRRFAVITAPNALLPSTSVIGVASQLRLILSELAARPSLFPQSGESGVPAHIRRTDTGGG